MRSVLLALIAQASADTNGGILALIAQAHTNERAINQTVDVQDLVDENSMEDLVDGLVNKLEKTNSMEELVSRLVDKLTYQVAKAWVTPGSIPYIHPIQSRWQDHHRNDKTLGSGPSKVVARSSWLYTPQPATSVYEAIYQARRALRTLLDKRREGNNNVSTMSRVTITLPIAAPGCENEDLCATDELTFPGGIQQMFRYLRPSVEALLEGRGPEFCGMLESDADGLGVWKADPNLTFVTLVGDLNVAPFLRLLKGEFGSARLSGVVAVVNSFWTEASAIGNFWQRQLKQDAKELLDEGGWTPLYHLEIVRLPRSGIEGSLLFSFPYPRWLVYDSAGNLVLESNNRPNRTAIVEALTITK